MNRKTIHFHCTACGKDFEWEVSQAPDLTQNIRNAGGSLIQGYEVYCQGLCRECAAGENSVDKHNQEEVNLNNYRSTNP